MDRIVRMPDGTHLRFEGQVVPDCWDVREWRANGVLERSARPAIAWTEIGVCDAPMTYEERAAYIVHNFEGKDRAKRLAELNEEIEERRLKSLRSSARRAKTMCRRVIITEGFDELLTLTYRENQTDRDLCKQHFEKWYRRMKKALGGFRFCASFERQERGAMHVHIATHKLPQHAVHKGVKIKAWELGTRIWRDIVGANNGLCFVGGKGRFGLPRRRQAGLAKMAAYVSKYIMKDFENAPEETNRYSRSNGTVVGKVEKMRLKCTLRELIEVTFEQGEGDVVIAHRVSKWSDGLWLCTESPPRLAAPVG
jgi:hypothetical protein